MFFFAKIFSKYGAKHDKIYIFKKGFDNAIPNMHNYLKHFWQLKYGNQEELKMFKLTEKECMQNKTSLQNLSNLHPLLKTLQKN